MCDFMDLPLSVKTLGLDVPYDTGITAFLQ
jgi:hypothetical protein